MFYYILKKEFKLIFRDIHALLVLFLMPTIFILIMSLALKNSYSQTIDTKLKVAILSSSNKDISEIIENINKNPYFESYLEDENEPTSIMYNKNYDFIVKLDKDFKRKIKDNNKDFSIEILSKPDSKYELQIIYFRSGSPNPRADCLQ